MGDRVELARSGGLAGRVLHATVAADALGPAERAGMAAVLERGAAGPGDPVPGAPDRFVYELTVVTGDARVRLVVGEAALDDRLAPLVRRLDAEAGG